MKDLKNWTLNQLVENEKAIRDGKFGKGLKTQVETLDVFAKKIFLAWQKIKKQFFKNEVAH